MHLLNQQITMEHLSTNCNDAYGIVKIPQSAQPPLCTPEQDKDEENNEMQYMNIQLLSNDPTNYCRAGMSDNTCDTTISNKEPSLNKEDSAPDYSIALEIESSKV